MIIIIKLNRRKNSLHPVQLYYHNLSDEQPILDQNHTENPSLSLSDARFR